MNNHRNWQGVGVRVQTAQRAVRVRPRPALSIYSYISHRTAHISRGVGGKEKARAAVTARAGCEDVRQAVQRVRGG